MCVLLLTRVQVNISRVMLKKLIAAVLVVQSLTHVLNCHIITRVTIRAIGKATISEDYSPKFGRMSK